MDKKTKKIILVLFIIFLSLRVIKLNEVQIGEEYIKKYFSMTGEVTYFAPHTPFDYYYHNLIYYMLGYSEWVSRLIPLIFSIINFFLIIYITNKYFDKKVCIISLMIITLSPWSLFYSTLDLIPGEIIACSYLISFILLFSIFENPKRWKYILLGINLFLSIMTYEYSAAIIPVLFYFYLLKYKKIDLNLILLIIITGGLTLLMIVADYFAYDLYITKSIISVYYSFDAFKHTTIPTIYYYGIILLDFMIWTTMLMIGLLILTYSKVRLKDFIQVNLKNLFIIQLLFFSYFIIKAPAAGGMFRTIGMIIPSIVILCAIELSKIKFTKKDIKIIIASTLMIFFLLIYFNYYNGEHVISYQRSNDIVSRIKNIEWNFFIFQTYMNNPGFLIKFPILLIFIFLPLIIMILFIITKNKTMFLIFLIISLPFMLFILSDYLFQPSSPKFTAMNEDFFKNYLLKQNFKEPTYIVSNNPGIIWYFRQKYPNTEQIFAINEDKNYIMNKKNQIINGTIVIFNLPPIPQDSLLWQLKQGCELKDKFEDKKYEYIYVYQC